MAVNISCNLLNVTRKKSACDKPMFAGTGDRIYVFEMERFKDGIPSPCGGLYNTDDILNGISKEGDSDRYQDNGIQGHCYAIDIKPDSGQVTSEKAEGSDFRTLTGTAVIDHHVNDFLAVDRAIAGSNIGVLIPDGSGYFYVLMSPFGKRTKYSSNYDSGTTYDSDHGFTITFTVAPVYSACPRVKIDNTSSLVATDQVATGEDEDQENQGD